MAHLCRRNFKSWKACLILVCNVVLNGASRLTAAALLSKDSSGNNDVMHVLARNTNILLNSTAVLYIIVGILADIRFGRYIQGGRLQHLHQLRATAGIFGSQSDFYFEPNRTRLPAVDINNAGMLILCLALCRGARGCNIQFIREPPSRSPYTSVFKVLQFAKNHKTPLHRSALTYWEDGPPSRLDMGKDKYGGPFTNEQVEDVKTFFRLLYSLACILFMYFLLSMSFREEFVLHFGREQQSSYSLQPKDPIYLITAHIFYSPIFATALLIPLHELVLHPLLGNRYLPNMMTKMKIAGILISASLAINLIIDGVGHYKQNVQCMFAAYTSATPLPGQLQAIDISPFILIVPGLMVDLAFPLLYISFLEFTVAQAPYPMRGMMIGFAYFFVGLFTILGAGYQRIFMSLALLSSWPGRYSCCTLYYTIGATVSLLVTVLTFWTTHKYKFRERSEVINEYQFIENYYSVHSN
ncbi:hypothetical protein EMCRGX_G006533 [Ephydatia muelleri]